MEAKLIARLLGALSLPQIVSFVLGTLAPILIMKLIPPGELQTTVLASVASLLGLLTVLLRKSSEDGGTALKPK